MDRAPNVRKFTTGLWWSCKFVRRASGYGLKKGGCLVACEHKLRSWRFLPECGSRLARVWILWYKSVLLLALYLAVTEKALQPDTLHVRVVL